MTIVPSTGPFDISNTNLDGLSPLEAVEHFHELLIAEAVGTATPVIAINVPKAINVADGGVDAEVDIKPGALLPGGLLRSGHVRYQIKTGSFSASGMADIKSLLVQPKYRDLSETKPDHLSPRVKACLDLNGTFVVVLFGSDAVSTVDDHGVSQIRAFLAGVSEKYKGAKVELVRANQICAATKVLSPALALSLNGLAGAYGAPFRTLNFLRDSCGLEISRYESTAELAELARAITDEANNLEGFRHIRILGDAGAGKSHLVFSALSASASKSHVLYCLKLMTWTEVQPSLSCSPFWEPQESFWLQTNVTSKRRRFFKYASNKSPSTSYSSPSLTRTRKMMLSVIMFI